MHMGITIALVKLVSSSCRIEYGTKRRLSLCVKISKTFAMLKSAYGEECLTSLSGWHKMFEAARQSLQGDERKRYPSASSVWLEIELSDVMQNDRCQ
jgi:hypothetical protein